MATCTYCDYSCQPKCTWNISPTCKYHSSRENFLCRSPFHDYIHVSNPCTLRNTRASTLGSTAKVAQCFISKLYTKCVCWGQFYFNPGSILVREKLLREWSFSVVSWPTRVTKMRDSANIFDFPFCVILSSCEQLDWKFDFQWKCMFSRDIQLWKVATRDGIWQIDRNFAIPVTFLFFALK